jgi:hypothetical protein
MQCCSTPCTPTAPPTCTASMAAAPRSRWDAHTASYQACTPPEAGKALTTRTLSKSRRSHDGPSWSHHSCTYACVQGVKWSSTKWIHVSSLLDGAAAGSGAADASCIDSDKGCEDWAWADECEEPMLACHWLRCKPGIRRNKCLIGWQSDASLCPVQVNKTRAS